MFELKLDSIIIMHRDHWPPETARFEQLGNSLG